MKMLEIVCMGRFQVTLDGEEVNGFTTDKTRALLVYLATESDRPHRREHLAGLLWSDQAEEKALHNLRQALSLLKDLLSSNENCPFLLISRDTIQFNPFSSYRLDVKTFHALLEEAYRNYHSRMVPGHFNVYLLQRAIALYRGHFMDQVHLIGSPLIEEWMALQAEDIDHHMIEALALVAEYHERRGEYTQARQALDRLAGIAPWDETAQVQLIRLLALDQQWSAAQSRYYSLRRYLRDQLGIEPQPETATLFEDIRKAAHLNLPFSPRFPPARQNLTTPSTAFVGRQNALDNLAEMLAQPHARVITLLGPGGIGKTRLALEAARQQVGLFADGVFAVPLASAEGQEALVPGIASAAGFQFHGSESPESQLMAFFRDKDILFVLDNFEHLLSPVKTGAQTGENIHQGVNFLVEALNQSPRLRFMVTSRAPLNLQMERVVEVGGLDFPPSEDGAGCQDYAAVKLFDLMARRLQPHFSLEKEQRAVSQICRMLEGSPLAIELSAAWIPIHSPDEITLARSKPAWITWQLTSAMCPTAIAACAWFSNTP